MSPDILERCGRLLAGTSTVPARDSSETELSRRVLTGAVEREMRGRRWRQGLSVSLLLVGLFSGYAWTRWNAANESAPVAFTVGAAHLRGTVGAYVAPSEAVPLALQFSEGSLVELLPGARARVSGTSPRGATVLLESGSAKVQVMHRPKAEWTVMAGPYSVHVHGTAFVVGFDAKSQVFELEMLSGIVSVEGPGLQVPVEIRGAQRFSHHAGASAAATSRGAPSALGLATSSLPLAASSSLAADGLASLPLPATHAPASSVTDSAATASSSWASRVARGDYAAVLRESEAQGWNRSLAQSNSRDLLALANAARFLGRSQQGREALMTLRQRYPSASESAQAAYLLGRLAESQAPADALSWYARYQREAPSGALLAEALGRRVVLLRDSGKLAEARELAGEYVRRFPDGPYAAVARKLLTP